MQEIACACRTSVRVDVKQHRLTNGTKGEVIVETRVRNQEYFTEEAKFEQS